jgi:hypothetical protein
MTVGDIQGAQAVAGNQVRDVFKAIAIAEIKRVETAEVSERRDVSQ